MQAYAKWKEELNRWHLMATSKRQKKEKLISAMLTRLTFV